MLVFLDSMYVNVLLQGQGKCEKFGSRKNSVTWKRLHL